MDLTLIIDTPEGIVTPTVADATPNVADLAPGDYRPDGHGGWKQVRREKRREEYEQSSIPLS